MATTTTTTTVLGKRRTRADPLVLRLSSSPEPFDVPGSSKAVSRSSITPILVNGALIPVTKKKFRCTQEGCEKSYTKPSRLAEHERSHTGERPFKCDTCGKSYLRETHLQAHLRSHLPESARPLTCTQPECTKRFWTAQHLRVHLEWHNGAKPFQCMEGSCDQTFSKHYQLRTHICEEHMPPGAKPYICDHEGCSKTFRTNQHLRNHTKIHDERRYTCIHLACLPEPGMPTNYFPTWTSLQHHLRTAHPPTCSRSECNGRVFASQKGLRAHQKLHEQRDLEKELEGTLQSDQEDEDLNPIPWKRRRGGEVGRDWKCDVKGCLKDFKSKKALTTHVKVAHLGRRDFICFHDGCGKSFGYKHLLQRHLAKVHAAPSTSDESDPRDEGLTDTESDVLNIDLITGKLYAERARVNVAKSVALYCPWPQLKDVDLHATSESLEVFPTLIVTANIGPPTAAATCDYAFSRPYDLRRHLRATHGVDIERERVEQLVKAMKRCGNVAAGVSRHTRCALTLSPRKET